MPSNDAPPDDDIRQSYNFAPGYHGLIYRADTSDYGAGPKPAQHHSGHNARDDAEDKDRAKGSTDAKLEEDGAEETCYKLQAMKWGLVPSWTKRNPGYSSLMRTINCRDDSLAENRGMWINMKKRKRCIVLCNGFYEWLKKNNGKERIPHYIKRKDGQLMCFAGLWDVVQYEGKQYRGTKSQVMNGMAWHWQPLMSIIYTL
jgi:putative SOS response-associated peptidase YedK